MLPIVHLWPVFVPVGGRGLRWARPPPGPHHKHSRRESQASVEPIMQSLRQIELPHTRSGDIDWNTLGNLLSACILGEVLCASYVDYKYGKRSKDIQADTDWQFYYEEKDVIALRKVQADSPINVFMGRTVIDLPIEDVVAFLENLDRRREWDVYLTDIKEMKRISETDVIMSLRLEAKRCFIKMQRELLLYERMKYVEGKYVRTTLSVNLPEFPPKPNLIRADARPGTGFVCEPYEGRVDKTLITYVAHVDLTGVPLVVINQAMKRQPMAVYRIRNILTGYRKPHLPALDLSNSLLVSHSPNTATDWRAVHSLTDEVELPVDEFIGTTFRPESIQRFHSVPADVHKISNCLSEEQLRTKTNGDESILQDNTTDKWMGTEVMPTPNDATDIQPSGETCNDEEASNPDQNELGMSVPELTLASMRNSSNKIDTHHTLSCENVCVNI